MYLGGGTPQPDSLEDCLLPQAPVDCLLEQALESPTEMGDRVIYGSFSRQANDSKGLM
jgi:hypothetical protein